MTKQEIRGEIKKEAARIDRKYFENASNRIADRVLRSQEYEAARSIFLYIDMPTEPDTGQILEAALSSGKRVLVPRCKEKPILEAVRIHGWEDLAETGRDRYGLREPQSYLPAADAAQIDLVIVPCVAASHDGRRLGHGAAYYDVFLSRADVSPKQVMCLCFEKFIRENIPEEAHDRRMDIVVTEAGIYRQGQEDHHEISIQTAGSMLPAHYI